MAGVSLVVGILLLTYRENPDSREYLQHCGIHFTPSSPGENSSEAIVKLAVQVTFWYFSTL